MSELFHRYSQEEMLRRIQERLSQGASSAVIIEEILPQSRDEALCWGRRLAVWDEYRTTYPAQVVALARLISRQAMKAFRLMMRDDGRVAERPAEPKGWKTPRPTEIFPLLVGGEEVQVEYTKGYFPNSGIDNVYFVSPHEPARPHSLSDSGHLSRFVPHDAVEARGGPQEYVALLAEAILRDEEQPFIEAFEGPLPVIDERRSRQAHRQPPEPGGHAERVIAEEKPQGSPRQGSLF